MSRVLPYMHIPRNNNTVWLFVTLFFYIIVTQVVVIQPSKKNFVAKNKFLFIDLNVWYFMMSTSLISIKLLISFWISVRSKPGYLERGEGK